MALNRFNERKSQVFAIQNVNVPDVAVDITLYGFFFCNTLANFSDAFVGILYIVGDVSLF